MRIPDPVRLFRALPFPTRSEDGESFRIVELGLPQILLGKSTEGGAAFLIDLEDGTPEGAVPLELPNLRVRHNCAVSLLSDEGTRSSGMLSVVECTSADPDLMELFLACMGHALPVEKPLGSKDLAGVVDHLVELFRSASQPTGGEVLGLWAELLVALSAVEPKRMLGAWHSKPQATVDFSSQFERLEVKATVGPYRRHQFSFEQLNPPAGITGAVVSVITQDLPGATTVWDLWQEALDAAGTDNDLRAKIDQICVKTLGQDWARARHTAFDRSLALDTMATFRCEAVPRLDRLPPGVGRVRFESDLSRAEPIDGADEDWSQLPLIGLLF